MSTDRANVAPIEELISSACRAPSLHNSQPWKWVLDGQTVRLYADASRLLPNTDSAGRQLVISCGAALDHVRAAAAAAGFAARISRLPNAGNPEHLATIELIYTAAISDTDVARGAAIALRRTDRWVFLPADHWRTVFEALHNIADVFGTRIEAIAPGRRAELVHVSKLAASRHRYDSTYKAELQWWTGRSTLPDGIPLVAVPSRAERSRVPVGRAFPALERQPVKRDEVGPDRSQILILTTPGDTRLEWLRCGEALSAILLECTVRGLATCSLTHMTEVAASRDLIRRMLAESGVPQVVIRVGSAVGAELEPTTPRRALTDVLEVLSAAEA